MTTPGVAPAPSAGGFGIDGLPKIAFGRGSYLFDQAGKRYLDGSGGPAVYALGHANEEVNDAVRRQMDRIAHGYRYTFASDAAEDLTEVILRNTGGLFDRVVFVSSGSEAVESCLKIALQYWTACGRPGKRRFICRRRSWHGNTLGALSVSDFKARRDPFEGALVPASFVSAANAYRPPAGVPADRLAAHLAAELEAEILAVGADRVAAFIFEPVVGAAGGVVPAPPGYARAMAEVCRRHDVLLIADEVMCGSGRTGTWRALAHDGVDPDLMSIAKGLAGGYLPLGAALCTARIGAALVRAHGGPLTGHTFTGHTAACAAGVAVQRIVARDGLTERVRLRGEELRAQIAGALRHIPEVGDVRGRGYFIGIELVRDPATREAFDPALRLHERIGARAFELGLIIYPCSGNVDGTRGDTVIVAPPYNASDAELGELTDLLARAVGDAVGTVRGG